MARDCRTKNPRRRENNHRRFNNYKRKFDNRNQRKQKGKYHADNVRVNDLNKEEIENYNEIFDNALSIDYNEDDVNQSNNAIVNKRRFHWLA